MVSASRMDCCNCRVQLALFLYAVQDGLAPVLHIAQVVQALFQLPHLGVVQGTGNFFAVAGDEGDGGALVQ